VQHAVTWTKAAQHDMFSLYCHVSVQQVLLQSRLADAQKQNDEAEQKHHSRLKEVARRCGQGSLLPAVDSMWITPLLPCDHAAARHLQC
jgi:hypothetical protein